MKYIVVKKQGLEVGIIFGEVLAHREVARIHNAQDIVVVSAGFCEFTDEDEFLVWGESESLGGMKSRQEDAKVLKRSIIS